jgi:hypothetical protein
MIVRLSIAQGIRQQPSRITRQRWALIALMVAVVLSIIVAGPPLMGVELSLGGLNAYAEIEPEQPLGYVEWYVYSTPAEDVVTAAALRCSWNVFLTRQPAARQRPHLVIRRLGMSLGRR